MAEKNASFVDNYDVVEYDNVDDDFEMEEAAASLDAVELLSRESSLSDDDAKKTVARLPVCMHDSKYDAERDSKHDAERYEKKYEVQERSVQVHSPFSDIPGFCNDLDEAVPRASFHDEKWMKAELKRLIRSSTYDHGNEAIKKRENARRTIDGRESKCDLKYQRDKRAFAKERAVLNETKRVDQNVDALMKEIVLTQKYTDPVARTAQIRAERAAKQREQEAFQARVKQEQAARAAQKAATEAVLQIRKRDAEEFIEQQRPRKRSRNCALDEEDEPVQDAE